MGEVRRPEDAIHRRGKPAPDLTPSPIPQPTTPSGLGEVWREIESLKTEVVKIKRALRARGIAVE